MQTYFADLHIHIGRTASGKPVKITGSKTLTHMNIFSEASRRKGMDIIGIVDCQVPEVIDELAAGIESGSLIELDGGGLRFENTTLIPASEIEINDPDSRGPMHVLAYLPSLGAMRKFSSWLSGHMKNISLSTQRYYGETEELIDTIHRFGGLFVPAHIFTPFKGIYGKSVGSRMAELLPVSKLDAIELGLSADTTMASQISELGPLAFLSNSDAHSLGKIGREYQVLSLENPDFSSLKKALKKEDGHQVIANYGMDPELGKYHHTSCLKCGNQPAREVSICPVCGHSKWIKGVYERFLEIKDQKTDLKKRPPYIHQAPLDFLPGIGPKMLGRLLEAFGTEMDILHSADYERLKAVAGSKAADLILAARHGDLLISPGGGGRFGKVTGTLKSYG